MMSTHSNFCPLNSTLSLQCSSCFYGPVCQFTTAYYGLTSLQSLLCSFEYMPISFLIVIFIFGSSCNVLTIGTFCQTTAREMGSGIYRLWIAIIGQCGLTVVIVHLFMEKHGNASIGCYTLEYLRKVFHALYDSLTVCTTFERTMVIYQGIAFNKIRSQRVAKVIIVLLILYHFVSILYEPFYRQLVYSSSQHWCTLKFPNHSLVVLESAINIYHFILPYFINSIVPIIWLFALTKAKSSLHKNMSTFTIFKNVLNTYKYTIMSCYILVLFNTPRFIFTSYFTCIRSRRQNTAYIISYFLSLVPLICNLFIFVLPSPKYRPELFRLVQRIIKYRYRNQYTPT